MERYTVTETEQGYHVVRPNGTLVRPAFEFAFEAEDEAERLNKEIVMSEPDDDEDEYDDTVPEPAAIVGDDNEDIFEKLISEAIESGDYAVVRHPENECCPGCGGFMGCACGAENIDLYALTKLPTCDGCGEQHQWEEVADAEEIERVNMLMRDAEIEAGQQETERRKQYRG